MNGGICFYVQYISVSPGNSGMVQSRLLLDAYALVRELSVCLNVLQV